MRACLVILGLDLRDYAEDGSFAEVAWSDFRPTGTNDVERSMMAARDALARPDRVGDAVLITWERSGR